MMMEIMPNNIKSIKGNRSLISYIEENNKIAMQDIIMYHRSPGVFDLIKQTYDRTISLFEYTDLSFRKILEGSDTSDWEV